MALYDDKLETELHTDASKLGVADLLMQRSLKGAFKPVAYDSRKMTDEEQKLHSYDLETLAVVASLHRFRVYLLGIKFKIITDSNALWTALNVTSYHASHGGGFNCKNMTVRSNTDRTHA